MLSTKIKEQTLVAHQRLESHPLFHSLNGDFNEADYLRLLSKLYAYYNVLEKAYVPFLLAYPDLEMSKRQRAHVLAKDIENRGGQIAPFASEEVLPVIDTLWKATGALYVIEGSSLGSRVISQALAKSGIDASNGAAYFNGYGVETGTMWKTFVQFLNEVASNEAEEKEVIESAGEVFATLYNWLEK